VHDVIDDSDKRNGGIKTNSQQLTATHVVAEDGNSKTSYNDRRTKGHLIKRDRYAGLWATANGFD